MRFLLMLLISIFFAFCGTGSNETLDTLTDDDAAQEPELRPDADDDAVDVTPEDGPGEPDAPPDNVLMKGELMFGNPVDGLIEPGDMPHGYTFYGIRSITVSAHLTPGTGLTAGFEIQSPTGEGAWGPVLDSSVVSPDTTGTLGGLSIPGDGVYRVVITDTTAAGGGYQVRVDCDSGCEVGICPEPVDPVPAPVGRRLKLLRDREVAVVDTGLEDFYVDLYDPASGGAYIGSRSLPAGTDIVDTTAGNIKNKNNDYVIFLVSGASNVVGIVDPAGDSGEEGTYVLSGSSGGMAITAGDVDADGVDEVYILKQGGNVTMVWWPPMEGPQWENLAVAPESLGEALDIAAGDVDRDGAAELALLYEASGGGTKVDLLDVGADGATSLVHSFDVDESYEKISLADLDADLQAEIVLFYEGGFWFMDQVSVYAFEPGAGASQIVPPHNTMSEYLIDMAVADTDHDSRATIYLLDEFNRVTAYSLSDSGDSLVRQDAIALTTTSTASFLCCPDYDGDSPAMKLASGPFQAKTEMKPIVVVVYPPAWGGGLEYYAEVGFGEDIWTEDRNAHKIGLSANASIGYKGGVPGMLDYNVKTQMSMAVSRNVKEWNKVEKGFYYSMKSSTLPHSAGGVLLSWTCYDGYIYDVYDPAGILGDSSHSEFSITIPRHVGNVFWTLDRFNSLSHEHGLEPIAAGIVAGDPSTYPSTMQDVYGNGLEADDLVIPDPYIFGASDSAMLIGYYRLQEISINEETLTTGFNVSGGVTVGPVTFDAMMGIESAWTHAVWVGDRTKFTFKAGPVIDDPETPVDEYFSYYYEFSPFVYRHSTDDMAYYAIYHYVSSLGPGY